MGRVKDYKGITTDMTNWLFQYLYVRASPFKHLQQTVICITVRRRSWQLLHLYAVRTTHNFSHELTASPHCTNVMQGQWFILFSFKYFLNYLENLFFKNCTSFLTLMGLGFWLLLEGGERVLLQHQESLLKNIFLIFWKFIRKSFEIWVQVKDG